ncbi:MAG: hypothetical protein N3G77_02540 [Nitrososphaeria archaeon]|nr:hypothetical protein [Nitrososphaeria archaeon]
MNVGVSTCCRSWKLLCKSVRDAEISMFEDLSMNRHQSLRIFKVFSSIHSHPAERLRFLVIYNVRCLLNDP